ncbi:DUF3047 domain-containing protein [Dinoroseobacter sp. S76]|uniref:DUF3047 domain-containing protein n=1 Tax=Dinoroseobacter sp. S76 TaxID=3415124 RepID=UPI003C7E1B65
MTYRATLTALALALSTPAFAEPVPFDGSWREQGFLRLFTNDFVQKGGSLDVISKGTVSLLWRAVPTSARDAGKASWQWAVAEGVGATDLRRKGGDDRNLALYFVFTDEGTAASVNPNSARKLLKAPGTRALVYVWGGDHAKNAVLPSPYHPSLVTIVKRGPGTGQFAENVDLRADYRKAFGEEAPVLIGLGVSADSDDTDGKIAARVSSLQLK